VSSDKTKAQFRKKDLISLVWEANPYSSSLISGVPKGTILDGVRGTWTFQGQTQEIGARCYSSGAIVAGNPIGVYDRTKIGHLRAMKDHTESIRTSIYDNLSEHDWF
jgi:hypothetical protein